MSTTPLTIDGLAQLVKAKYPDYANRDNAELVQAVVTKHPEYQQHLAPQELSRVMPGSSQPYNPQPTGMERVAQGAAIGVPLGMARGAGIPLTEHPVSDLASNLNQQVNQAATTPWGQGGPIYGTLAMIGNMLKGTIKGELQSGKDVYQGIKQSDPEKAFEGVASGLTTPLMMRGAAKTPEAVTSFPEQLRTGGQEMLGEGPSKYTLLEDLHQHAQRTQAHVRSVADAVHADAQQAMSDVTSKIDAANPKGTFPKADIKAKVGDAVGDIVKVKEQLPPTLGKILAEEKAPRSTGPTIGGRHFDLSNPNDLRAFQRFKDQGVITPEEAARMEGTSTNAGSYSAEQLKQFRSDLGREMQGLDKRGAVGAAAKSVYGVLSDELRRAAKNSGVENDWLSANAKYHQYMNDFVRSPVRRILSGSNASQIMAPLAGDSGVAVKNILSKYADYGIDADKLAEETRRFSGAKTVQRFSRPGRLDLIMAGISPKMAALRVGLPALMRKPGALDATFGKGFDDVPTIPAKKVALDIRKGNPTVSSPAPWGLEGPPPDIAELFKK